MAEKVFLTRLKLADFRNYAEASLRFDGRHVVFAGSNGAGKTNLLEAISLLSPGRGLRRATYPEILRKGASGGFSIFADLVGRHGEVAIGTGTEGADGALSRKLRINGAAARSVDELSDHASILWLTPAMDGLFTGSSADRRRFLDRLVLALDPAHGRRSADFERAMRARNRLLCEPPYDPVWLTGLERQMAELAIAIALARREMLDLLTRLIAERGDTSFPTARLALEGFLDEDERAPASDLEQAYAIRLGESRARDAAAGRTLEGPHRSDLIVHHAEKDMDAGRCSTGEQKALLTGLILAQARLVGEMTGATPILLLDEIAAHLDPARRAALFDLIDELGGQAFMTGTDRDMFAALGDRAIFFEVSASGLRNLSEAI